MVYGINKEDVLAVGLINNLEKKKMTANEETIFPDVFVSKLLKFLLIEKKKTIMEKEGNRVIKRDLDIFFIN